MEKSLTAIANLTVRAAGHPVALGLCISGVLIWAVIGLMFGFSDRWQLAFGRGATIITFLMALLIRATQKRNSAALLAKMERLDELMRQQRSRRVHVNRKFH